MLSEQFVSKRERELVRGGVPLSRCCHLHSQRLTKDTSQRGFHCPAPPIPGHPKVPRAAALCPSRKGLSRGLTVPHMPTYSPGCQPQGALPTSTPAHPMIMWLSGNLPLPGNKSLCSPPLGEAPKPSFLRLTPAGAQSSSSQRPLTSPETPNTTHWDTSIQHPLKEIVSSSLTWTIFRHH